MIPSRKSRESLLPLFRIPKQTILYRLVFLVDKLKVPLGGLQHSSVEFHAMFKENSRLPTSTPEYHYSSMPSGLPKSPEHSSQEDHPLKNLPADLGRILDLLFSVNNSLLSTVR